MNFPLSLRLGLKYVRAKRHNRFISFISAASTIGIALGVAVLITVMSVMNGFDQAIQKKIFSLADQVTVTSYSDRFTQWQEVASQFTEAPHYVASAPFVDGQGLISYAGQMNPVILKGILPEQQELVSDLSSFMVQGSHLSLGDKPYQIIIGDELAYALDVGLGDKVTVMTPEFTSSPMGALPTYKRFTVSGIFHFGSKVGYDQGMAFIYLPDAQKLFRMSDAITGWRLKIDDLYSAPALKSHLKRQLPRHLQVRDWTDQYGHFFAAIQMEKTMMFLVMLLIIAIASFNLVSMQVMLVTDKQSEIAILRTLGASKRTILATFMIQGCTIGFIGICFGVLLGILLSLNAPDIIHWLEHLINQHFVNEKVYWISHLPSELSWTYVIKVSFITMIMTLLATLYPSIKAAKVLPAQALRYE